LQRRAREVRAGERRAGEIGARQVGALQVTSREVLPRQVRAGEVGRDVGIFLPPRVPLAGQQKPRVLWIRHAAL